MKAVDPATTAFRIPTKGPNSTERVAAALVQALEPPLCFALSGPLGAGKTTFVRGVVRGLGGDMRVKSPTFALAHTYDTTPRVHHIDLYRLDDEGAAHALGLEEMILDEGAYSCVEWPEHGPDLLTGSTSCRIRFSDEAGEERTLTCSLPTSPQVDRIQEVLAAAARGEQPPDEAG